MIIPDKLISGDSWSVTLTSDSTFTTINGWSLNLSLRGTSNIILNGTYDSNTKLWTIGATSIQAIYEASDYAYFLYFTKLTERKTVEIGNLIVLPDPATTRKLDNRTHNEKMVIAIEAFIEGRANKGQLDHIKSVIDGKELERMPMSELIKLRQTYLRLMKIEKKQFPVGIQYKF